MICLALYQFNHPTNATSVETLYRGWNCTDPECDLSNDTVANNTNNDTLVDGPTGEPLGDIILMGVLSVVLGLMILVTVIGEFVYKLKCLQIFIQLHML